jgi:hypothetical protein
MHPAAKPGVIQGDIPGVTSDKVFDEPQRDASRVPK